MIRRPALALLAVALAGPAAAEEGGPKGAPPGWAGDWAGSYVCAQGPTGLTLRLRMRGDGGLAGLFHFYPLARNPGAAEGCFELSAPPSGGQPPATRLEAGRWLLQPPGYVTVDLHAELDEEGQLFGTVEGPGCTLFGLRRAAPPRPIPAACGGAVAIR